MSHIDEGTIVALRDGSLVTDDASEHLSECPRCRTTLDDARRRAELIAESLSALDGPIDYEAAKAALRARLDSGREGGRTPGRTRWHVGRAAAVLLVTAGAAYALPGSPVRDWVFPTDADPEPTAGVEGGVSETLQEGGIEVNVPEGRIQIVLTGLAPGSDLVVAWMDAATARIAAAPGSSFSFAEGRAEARVAPGPVRVELPRFAPVVSVEVDGRMYLRRTSAGLEVSGPVVERTDERIRFTIPQR